MGQYSSQWWFADGTLASNQRAAVFLEDANTYAAIFADAGLTIPLANPTTSDINGFVNFFAADDAYWIFVGSVDKGASVLARVGAPPEGPVLTVNSIAPDIFGNVQVGASDVGAIPINDIVSKGDILVGTGAGTVQRLPVGASDQALFADSETPTGLQWATIVELVDSVNGHQGVVVLTNTDIGSQPLDTIQAKGDLYAGTADNATTNLSVGANGTVLTADSSQVTGLRWDVPPSAPVTSVNGLTGVVVLTASSVQAIPTAIVTAKADLITATASNVPAHLPVGVDGTVLTADSSQSTGLRWDVPPSAPVTSVNGLTGAVVLTASSVQAIPTAIVAAKADLITATGSNAPVRFPIGTDGQVLAADSTTSTGLRWSDDTGDGNVDGPASSTDDAITRFDGVTGKLIQNSNITIDDNGVITLPGQNPPPTQANGQLFYSSITRTLEFNNDDVIIKPLQVGRQTWVEVHNDSGSMINVPSAVYVTSSDPVFPYRPNVAPTLSDTEVTARFLGITLENISDGATGFVLIEGLYEYFPTLGFSEGDYLYLNHTVPGTLTNIKPVAPNFSTCVGIVTVASNGHGTINVFRSPATLGLGAANQVRGINAAGSGEENKTLAGTAGRLTATNTVGAITFDVDPTLSNSKVDKATLAAKGSLISASAAATPVNVAVGTNGQVLTADSTQTAGVSWVTPTDTGDVSGPGSSTDKALARFNGTGGNVIQNSPITVSDLGTITLPGQGFPPTYGDGNFYYDSNYHTLTFTNDDSSSIFRLGTQVFVRVSNVSGGAISIGSPVYCTGNSGTFPYPPTVDRAVYTSQPQANALGVAAETIISGTEGWVLIEGLFYGYPTSGYNPGDYLYVGSLPGTISNVRPPAPNFVTVIGTVTAIDSVHGSFNVIRSVAALGYGSANQVRGVNAAGTAEENKTIQGTAGRLDVTNTTGAITIDVDNTLMNTKVNTSVITAKGDLIVGANVSTPGTLNVGVDGDFLASDSTQTLGVAWKPITSSLVTSVNGLTGAVTLTSSSVGAQPISTIAANGDLYLGTGSGATTNLPAGLNGQILTIDGTAPHLLSWKAPLVSSVNGHNGVVVLSSGDVGAQPINTITTKGDLYGGTGAGATARVGVGSNGQILTADSTASTGVSWQAPPSAPVSSVNGHTGVVVLTSADTGSQALSTITSNGDLYIGTGAGATTRLAAGTNLQVLGIDGTAPHLLEWQTLTAAYVGAVPTTTQVIAGTGLSGGGALSANVTLSANFGTTAGTITQGNDARITGAQQTSVLTTKADLYVATAASTVTREPVGSDGQVLTADSTQTTGIKWATPAAAPVTSVNGHVGVVVLTSADTGSVPTTTQVIAGTGLTGGGALSANVTLSASFGTTAGTITQGNDSRVVNAQQVTALTALGDLYVATASATTTRFPAGTNTQVIRANSATSTGLEYHTLVAGDVGAVPTTTQVIAGTGLTGGGALSSNVTLSANFGTTAGTITQGNDTRVVNAAQGPGASTANAIARWNGTGGLTLENSNTVIDSFGNITLTNQGPIITVPPNGSLTWSDSSILFRNFSGQEISLGFTSFLYVLNSTGSTIAANSAVYINGFSGTSPLFVPTIALADATDSIRARCVGIVTSAISNGSNGYVQTLGGHGLGNTTGATSGNPVYLSNVPGTVSPNKQSAPNFSTVLGTYGAIDATFGTMHVSPDEPVLGTGTNGNLNFSKSTANGGVESRLPQSTFIFPSSTGSSPAGGVIVSRSTVTVTLNLMYLVPFAIPVDASISIFEFEVTTLGIGSVARGGIYASSPTTFKPTGSPIADYGTVATTSSGVKLFAVGTVLTAGVYYAALVGQTATSTWRFGAGFTPYVQPATFPSGAAAGVNNCWTQAGVSGALPAIGALADANGPIIGLSF